MLGQKSGVLGREIEFFIEKSTFWSEIRFFSETQIFDQQFLTKKSVVLNFMFEHEI